MIASCLGAEILDDSANSHVRKELCSCCGLCPQLRTYLRLYEVTKREMNYKWIHCI